MSEQVPPRDPLPWWPIRTGLYLLLLAGTLWQIHLFAPLDGLFVLGAAGIAFGSLVVLSWVSRWALGLEGLVPRPRLPWTVPGELPLLLIPGLALLWVLRRILGAA